MSPKQFRWQRLRYSLRHHPTAQAEALVAFFFVIVPCTVSLAFGADFPPLTARLLGVFYVTERGMALAGLGLGLAQIWGTGTAWFPARAWISTAIAVALTFTVAAYWATGYVNRWAVSLMVGVILAQMFIASRCWTERPVGRANGGDTSTIGKALHVGR